MFFFDFVFFFGENKNIHLLQCKIISLSCFFCLVGALHSEDREVLRKEIGKRNRTLRPRWMSGVGVGPTKRRQPNTLCHGRCCQSQTFLEKGPRRCWSLGFLNGVNGSRWLSGATTRGGMFLTRATVEQRSVSSSRRQCRFAMPHSQPELAFEDIGRLPNSKASTPTLKRSSAYASELRLASKAKIFSSRWLFHFCGHARWRRFWWCGWRLEKFCRVVHLDVKQGQDVDRFGDVIPRISVVMWHKVANHCTAVWRGGQDEFSASSQDAVAFELRSRN